MKSELLPTPLEAWFCDVISVPVAIYLDDLHQEARENMWSFSLTAAEANALSVKDCETFVQRVVETRRQQLQPDHLTGSFTFYCWCDQSSAQLRLSVVSSTHGTLPFDCALEMAGSVEEIVKRFVESDYHEGIPWSEFKVLEDGEGPPPPEEAPLAIWSTRMP